jgi:hypothetical protein
VRCAPWAQQTMAVIAGVDFAESVDDIGYLFKYVGGIKFRSVEEPVTAAGYAHCVAVSNKYGLVAYSDLEGTPLQC